MKSHCPRIVCMNGISLSVQASEYHYSQPREDKGPYHLVEVGFIHDTERNPVKPPDSWSKYADGSFPSDVYGYVPVELVNQFITDNGGIDLGRTL